MRTVFVVLSAAEKPGIANGSESLRLRALRRGWLARVPPSEHLVWMLPHTLDRASSFKFTGSISGTALFEALRAARKQRGEADWFMLGDDDTHVDPEAVDSFVRAASPSLDSC